MLFREWRVKDFLGLHSYYFLSAHSRLRAAQPLRLWEINTALPLSPLTGALTGTWAKSSPGNLCVLSLGIRKGIQPSRNPSSEFANMLGETLENKKAELFTRQGFSQPVWNHLQHLPGGIQSHLPNAERTSKFSECPRSQEPNTWYNPVLLTVFVCLGTAASDSEKNSIPQLNRAWSWAGSAALLQPPFWNHGQVTKALQVFCCFFPLLPPLWNAITLSLQTQIWPELIPKEDLLPQRACPQNNASPAIRNWVLVAQMKCPKVCIHVTTVFDSKSRSKSQARQIRHLLKYMNEALF